MKTSRGIERFMAGTFILIMTAAFYATAEYKGGLPVLPVGIRYAADVLVIGMGALWIMVTVDMPKIRFLYSISVIMMVPVMGIGLISMAIWLIRCQETSFVTRGTINIVCLLLNILCAGAGYYMFGKRTVSYMLYAACATIVIITLDLIKTYGAGNVLSEYVTLITTFSKNTGPIMRKLELHDLTQGLGVFVMYYLYCIKNRQWHIGELMAAAFFFSTGLKRIDVLAILTAIAVGLLYDVVSEKMKTALVAVLVAGLFVFSYLYLFLIKKGWYQPLMDHLGIDTMSRGYIYDFFKEYYEMSPSFLGYGIRYIFKIRYDYKQYNVGPYVPGMAHNDIMTHFIELGFWGFIYWLWSNTWYKVMAVRKKFGSRASAFMLMTVVYSFVTYITDNTFFYYSINMMAHITVIAYTDQHRKTKEGGDGT
ncbi:O-antigen ligase family protein [Enterocloster citroniae]|uniref:O-antigen ligase family protein n=1 Tax=Enterocloster citroniae TaxID=358743 RepID=UPI002ED376B3